jgi:hypothetical protein
MGGRRVAVVAVVLACTAVFAAWLWSPMRQLVHREPEVSARADRYTAELRSSRRGESYSVRSPDGRYVVFSVVAAEVYHTISMLDALTGEVHRIVSVLEADPYSGSSHWVEMSADGQALLIGGRGSLAGEIPHHLCLVYLVAEDALLRPSDCGGADDR